MFIVLVINKIVNKSIHVKMKLQNLSNLITIVIMMELTIAMPLVKLNTKAVKRIQVRISGINIK